MVLRRMWCDTEERVLTKAKAVPLHAMRRLRERRYSSYSYLISVLDGGGQPHALAAL
jgi:hypothetical protein